MLNEPLKAKIRVELTSLLASLRDRCADVSEELHNSNRAPAFIRSMELNVAVENFLLSIDKEL